MKKDLGTYYARVELKDGRGWIQKWNTGARYLGGSEDCHPLNAVYNPPSFEDDDEVTQAMYHNYLDGNGSCNCNKWAAMNRVYSYNKVPLSEAKCGDTMPLLRLTAIRPDGSEVVLYEDKEQQP